MFTVRIQKAAFSLAQEEQNIRAQNLENGAMIAFQGMVRRTAQNNSVLNGIVLEHIPEVTEQEIQRIVCEAKKRWSINACCVIHRIGFLAVNEPIILILVCASHRQAAFDATQFIMDYLKTEAPFWKKECFSDGAEQWVLPKDSDASQKLKWCQ